MAWLLFNQDHTVKTLPLFMRKSTYYINTNTKKKNVKISWFERRAQCNSNSHVFNQAYEFR